MRDRRFEGDSSGYGGESRGYRGDGRWRSPTPPRRQWSPPSGRYRNGGGRSPPRRRRYVGEVEEGRRGGGSLRRDYDRGGDRGNRDYDQRSYRRGDKGSGREYDMNFSGGEGANGRVYDRNFIRKDRGNNRDLDRNFSRGDGGDRGYDRDHGRHFSGGEGNDDGNPSRRGDRISSYGFVDRDREYGDRERDRDDGHSQSKYQSGGNGEYSWRMNGATERTSSKIRWDHLLDETRSGFKSSINNGVVGSEIRSGLNYDYQSSKFLDKGHDGLVADGNPVPVEAERERDYASSSYPMSASFPIKSSSHVDAIGSASRYSSNLLQKDEDFHFQDEHRVGKFATGGPIMRDPLGPGNYKDKSLPYSRTDTDYTLSSSRLKGFDPRARGSFKEDISSSLGDDFNLPSDGIRSSTGLMTNTTFYDGVGEISQNRSPMNHGGRFGDLKSYSQSYIGTAEGNHRDYKYPQVQGDEAGKFLRLTETYGTRLGVGEDYSHQDTSRSGGLDMFGDKADVSSHQGFLRGSQLLDHGSTSLGLSISDRDDAYQSFQSRKKGVEDQRYRDPFERELNYGPGSSLIGKQNHDEEEARTLGFPHGRSDTLPSREYVPLGGDIDGNYDEELLMRNVSLSKPISHRLTQKHAGKRFDNHGNLNYAPRDASKLWSNNGDPSLSSKSLRVHISKRTSSKWVNMPDCHQSPSDTISLSLPSLRKSNISGSRDIKKRLGPVSQTVHVSQRLMKRKKSSLKNRLGPRSKKNHVTLPWLKNRNVPNLSIIQDESSGNAHLQGEDPPKDNVAPAKSEPPENSEDFKQLVKTAFFKFVKQLNGSPAKRRKYKEQGIPGSLKCLICQSQEEFVSTESLAEHALTCQKIGLRSQHLGFHRALCALMGWKFAAQSNTTWSCEKLSVVENRTLREDLILWPPVVIIHNSTIGSEYPDQQVIVTIEELEAKLRDMGFGDKAKVYRGKPANQSVMVVEFAGTLSGLQEAQRLHKVFDGSNRGRAEFLEVKSSSSNQNHGKETESVVPVKNLDSVLYGYSGIAEDLDKLDFDAKKRRLVKSKKEIEDIAEAPIKTG